MRIYSISNLSEKEYNDLIEILTHRKRLYILLSLTIVLLPIMMSCALYCDKQITYLLSGGSKGMHLYKYMMYIIVGLFIPLLLYPVITVVKPFRNAVLGVRLAD